MSQMQLLILGGLLAAIIIYLYQYKRDVLTHLVHRVKGATSNMTAATAQPAANWHTQEPHY